MRRFIIRIIVATLAPCLIAVALPKPAAASTLDAGEASAQRAALGPGPSLSESSSEQPLSLRDGWRRAFARADTTGYEFPEDDEDRSTAGLIKDVLIWTTVAAFVAYFIVNAFLKGDDPEPKEDDGGKELPPFTLNPAPAGLPPS